MNSNNINLTQWNNMLGMALPKAGRPLTEYRVHQYIGEKMSNGHRWIKMFNNKTEMTSESYTKMTISDISLLSRDIVLRGSEDTIIENGAIAREINGKIRLITDAKRTKWNSSSVKMSLLAIKILKFVLIGFCFFRFERSARTAAGEVLFSNRIADASRRPIWEVRDGEIHSLIYWGANIEERDRENFTPLMRAVRSGLEETVALLIKAGADVNAKNGSVTAISVAVDAGHYHIAKMLQDAGSLDIEGRNSLMRAILRKDVPTINALIARGVSLTEKDYKGNTALIHAINMGLTEVVKKLISKGIDVNERDEFGNTPLIQAVSLGNLELVKLLIEFKANIFLKNSLGESAAKIAHIRKNKLCEEALLRAGAFDHDGITLVMLAATTGIGKEMDELLSYNSNLNTQHEVSLDTAAHFAARQGHGLIIKKLIDKGANLDIPNKDGNTPLMVAILSKKGECVDLLIKSGAKLNQVNRLGQSALILAAEDNNKELIADLIKNKADIELKDINGRTALSIAQAKRLKVAGFTVGSSDVVDVLLYAGAKDIDGKTLLMKAILAKKEGEVKKIIDALISLGKSLDVQDKDGYTALHYAARCTEKEGTAIAKLLLTAGAAIDIQCTVLKRTPLMYAIPRNLKTTELLLDSKANFDLQDNNGSTPLIIAVNNGDFFAVKALINKGADISEKDFLGNTALRIAVIDEKTVLIKEFLGESLYDKLMEMVKNRRPITLRAMLVGSNGLDVCRALVNKISPGLLLSLPLLLNDEKMLQEIAVMLKPEDLQRGMEYLSKNYPNSCEWIRDGLYKVDPLHLVLKSTSDVVPNAPAGVYVPTLLHMFDKINFTNPTAPGYRNPGKLFDDGNIPVTQEALFQSLEDLIKHIRDRDPHLGTPNAGTPHLAIYYDDLEKILKNVVFLLQNPEIDLDKKASILIDLAVAGKHCGGRWKSEALACYEILSKPPEDMTLIGKIGGLLQNYRLGVLETIARNQPGVGGAILNGAWAPHIQNHYLRMIGQEMALPGWQTTHEDPVYGLHHVNKIMAKDRFLSHYTPRTIVQRIEVAINGPKDITGKRFSAMTKELDPYELLFWFQGNVPDDWRSVDFGTTKKMLKEDHEKFLAYRDKSKFKSLMVEYGKSLINQILLQYGVSEVSDPTNGSQIADAISKKKWPSAKVKESSEKAIKDRVTEIIALQRIDASETLMDRYLNLIINRFILEEKYKLTSVKNPQDWKEVVKSVDERRAQSFVAECIDESTGFVKRRGISYMLEKMGVIRM